MNIHTILDELNLENGSKHKLAVLKKHSDNQLLKRVLKMTYDSVTYIYGMSTKHWDTKQTVENENPSCGLEFVLDFMEQQLVPRHITGNAAIEKMTEHLDGLSNDDRQLIFKILNRDLRINMGRTLINKVFADLILKPVYMRCGIFSPKTAKDISFPAYIQLKADGTYREAAVENGTVKFVSRSGESYSYPILEAALADSADGYYTGELLVRGVTNRAEGNGLINSDAPPHDLIEFHVWDYITSREYANAHTKIANKTPYHQRFSKLAELVSQIKSDNIFMIENHEVQTLDEALQHTSAWMEQDLEGGILKDKSGLFKNGTSKHQLKLKLELDLDVRITGFQEGTLGTVREKTFGAILFETDDGAIKGRTSGFTDAQLEDFNSRREELIGQIMTVKCNDITRGRSNEHYALSHPRFGELRSDKTETDTLERALEIKEMAKGLKI